MTFDWWTEGGNEGLCGSIPQLTRSTVGYSTVRSTIFTSFTIMYMYF